MYQALLKTDVMNNISAFMLLSLVWEITLEQLIPDSDINDFIFQKLLWVFYSV